MKNIIITGSSNGFGLKAAMGENFAQMLQSENAPDPQWVVDAYLKLATTFCFLL
jgi:hypothetical protein